jgi:hypothetical protein
VFVWKNALTRGARRTSRRSIFRGGGREAVPIVLRVDAEPDSFFTDPKRPEPWQGYEEALRFFAALRPRLEAASRRPCHLTWLFRSDPQIAETYGSAAWAFETYRPSVCRLEQEGDEIGLHVHAFRWMEPEGTWCIDHGNQPWVDRCVAMGLTAFFETRHRDCRAFAFGDRWLSNETVLYLDERGVRYDLTLEPGAPSIPTYHPRRPYTGRLPDCRGVPRYPYRPSKQDYRVPSPDRRQGIWMMPLSTLYYPLRVIRKVYNRLRSSVTPRQEHMALSPSHEPHLFRRFFDEHLYESDAPIVMVARTNSFIPGRSRNHLDLNFGWLLRHPENARFRFDTPEEALRDCDASPKTTGSTRTATPARQVGSPSPLER